MSAPTMLTIEAELIASLRDAAIGAVRLAFERAATPVQALDLLNRVIHALSPDSDADQVGG